MAKKTTKTINTDPTIEEPTVPKSKTTNPQEPTVNDKPEVIEPEIIDSNSDEDNMPSSDTINTKRPMTDADKRRYFRFFTNSAFGITIVGVTVVCLYLLAPILEDIFYLFFWVCVMPLCLVIGLCTGSFFIFKAGLVLMGMEVSDIKDLWNSNWFGRNGVSV